MARNVLVSLHAVPAEFRVREFPSDGYRSPFVSLEVAEEVSVLVSDPAVLTALAELALSARTWLAAEVSGQAPLPVEPVPVGDTGLTLHPLPVGVA